MGNEIKFPSEMQSLQTLEDNDAILLASGERSYGSAILSILFTWIKNKLAVDFAGSQINSPQPTDLIPIYRPAPAAGDPEVSGLASIDIAALKAEIVGIDHSILTEQLIPGEFFVGRDGTRKQVYGKRVAAATKLLLHAEGSYCIMRSLITNIDSIVNYEGFIAMPKTSDAANPATAYAYYAPMSISESTDFNFTVALNNDSPYWGNNALAVQMVIKDAATIDRISKIDMFVKYTKL